MLKIEGYELENYGGYYSNIDESQEIHQDSGPLIVLERVENNLSVWEAKIMTGPWCENLAFKRRGGFHYLKKQLARAIREEQHIYA
jgi:hypothetical protein